MYSHSYEFSKSDFENVTDTSLCRTKKKKKKNKKHVSFVRRLNGAIEMRSHEMDRSTENERSGNVPRTSNSRRRSSILFAGISAIAWQTACFVGVLRGPLSGRPVTPNDRKQPAVDPSNNRNEPWQYYAQTRSFPRTRRGVSLQCGARRRTA